ncbi:MAG: hypothetical protein ACR2QG_04625 [Gammaproteobacteria bacterium]
MNYVNYVRFPVAAFAMLCAVGVLAQDASSQVDRLQLDSSSITGNQELPKVMYIVPWKEAGMSELQGKPANSLIDEVLAPLDRDVFRRQVHYFDQLNSQER